MMSRPGKPTVSMHAIVRWLERAEGVDVEEERRDLAAIDERAHNRITDAELAPWLLAKLGRSFEDMERIICTPAVTAAWSMGATRLASAGVILLFSQAGVKTVQLGTATRSHQKRTSKGEPAQRRPRALHWRARERRGWD